MNRSPTSPSRSLRPGRVRARLLVALAVPILTVLASCTGDDDPPIADPTTIATSASAPTTTTTSVPPTTAPTTSPPTTLPTTTATTTTAPDPTTTSPPTDALAQQIVAAAENSYRLYSAALHAPADEQLLAALELGFTGASLDDARVVVEGLGEQGYRVVTFEPLPSRIDVDIATIVVDEVAGTATFEQCTINSDIVIEPAGNPDGTDRVIDDSIAAQSYSISMVRSGDAWLIENQTLLRNEPGATTCAG